MQNTNDKNASEQTKPAFTPGPWTVEDFYIKDKDGNSIAFTYQYSTPESHENGLSNARLIACAPEMLALLEKALNALNEFPNRELPGLDGSTYKLAISIEKLIAKAKGEANV